MRPARYVALARMQARTAMLHRTDYAIGLLRVLLQIFLLRVVWTALYAGRPVVDGVALSTTVGYAVLSSLQK